MMCLKKYSGIGLMLGGAILLTACQNLPQFHEVEEPAPAAAAAPSNLTERGFRYDWPMGSSAVVFVPQEIHAQADAACIADQFDRAFMNHVEFNDTTITGYFLCRGADGT